MQTFVPYADVVRSARVLDTKRLGKQRSETMIIWKTLTGEYEKAGKQGWPNHPAVWMWEDAPEALLHYGLEICSEWHNRGYADNGTLDWFSSRISWGKPCEMPWWWGREDVHRSHRSQLLSKDPDYYTAMFPREEKGLPYVWPTARCKVNPSKGGSVWKTSKEYLWLGETE